jgi:hypothetical protein
MLIPALIGLAFPSSLRRRNHGSNPHNHPEIIELELSELLPELDETISAWTSYFQLLNDEDKDSVDEVVEGIMISIWELRDLLARSKTRSVYSLGKNIRREVDGIPKMLIYLMYHSSQPLKQREYAEILRLYGAHISKESFIRDTLIFLRSYFATRWKWTDDLVAKTATKINSNLRDTK